MDDVVNLPGLAKPQDALKKPRKPRPSEIAAKAAKTKKKTRKTAKPKAKKKSKPAKVKRPKVVKTKREPGKPKVRPAAIARSERLDFRLTRAEKIKVLAVSKKTRRTITSLFLEAIEKIK